MTITARWADLEPGSTAVREHHETLLSSAADVRALMDRLSEPNTSEAHLVHNDRPQRFNELFGQHEVDHQVVVGVWRGFGYLEFIGPGHHAQLAGDPASPEWHTSASDHFPMGSGVAVDDLVAAVAEFLVTRELPTCVAWREWESGRLSG
jgi:hypothetical protein